MPGKFIRKNDNIISEDLGLVASAAFVGTVSAVLLHDKYKKYKERSASNNIKDHVDIRLESKIWEYLYDKVYGSGFPLDTLAQKVKSKFGDDPRDFDYLESYYAKNASPTVKKFIIDGMLEYSKTLRPKMKAFRTFVADCSKKFSVGELQVPNEDPKNVTKILSIVSNGSDEGLSYIFAGFELLSYESGGDIPANIKGTMSKGGLDTAVLGPDRAKFGIISSQELRHHLVDY
jgi:hypothetical protein